MLPGGSYPANYDEDTAIVRTRLQWGILIASLAVFFCVPLFTSPAWMGFINITLIYIVAVLGLNILTGYCGQISIAQAAFMAVGGYSSALLVTKLGFPFWIALPCAGIITGLVGLIFGLPSLRIRGFYLLLATLAAQFIIMSVIRRAEPLTGGMVGMRVPAPQLGGVVFDTDRSYYYVIAAVLLIMTFFSVNIIRSKAGRAFIAIRDSELSAEVMGINLYTYKLLAFFIGCFYAGVAGSLWAHYMRELGPEQFTLMNSIWFLGMMIVGGMGSTLGAYLGTIFIRGLEEATLIAGPALANAFPLLGRQITVAAAMIVFGLVIVVFLIFEPRGLAHRWEVLKSTYRMYPFSY